MSKLNKKNGNLRGVGVFHSNNESDWEEISAQGWAIHLRDGYGFNISVTDKKGWVTSLEITEKALDRMLASIDDLAEPINPIPVFSLQGIEGSISSCNVDGCICQKNTIGA